MKRSTQFISKTGAIITAVVFSVVAGPQLSAQQNTAPPPSTQLGDIGARYQNEFDRFRQQGMSKKKVNGRDLKLSSAESKVLERIEKALKDKNYNRANELIAEAGPIVSGADAYYVLSSLQLQLAEATGDTAMATKATDALLAAPDVPAAALPFLLTNQGAYAAASGDFVKAEGAYAKLAQLSPRDADVLLMLAQTKLDLKKHREALELINRAVVLRKEAKQDVPEQWTSSALKIEAFLAANGTVSR